MVNRRFINFRKLGASNIPFYRSGSPNLLLKEDINYLTNILKIKAYFDFRTDAEFAITGKPVAVMNSKIEYIRLIMNQIQDEFFKLLEPTPKDYGLFYTRMLPDAVEVLRL